MTRTRFLIVLLAAIFIAAAMIIASSTLSSKAPESYSGATLVYAREHRI